MPEKWACQLTNADSCSFTAAKALEEDRLEDAERLAHRLKGAGGSYGYPTLSEVAKSLELAAKAQDVARATSALAEVKEVCVAIQTGWTGDAAEAGQP